MEEDKKEQQEELEKNSLEDEIYDIIEKEVNNLTNNLPELFRGTEKMNEEEFTEYMKSEKFKRSSDQMVDIVKNNVNRQIKELK